jgi:hypothetical protein
MLTPTASSRRFQTCGRVSLAFLRLLRPLPGQCHIQARLAAGLGQQRAGLGVELDPKVDLDPGELVGHLFVQGADPLGHRPDRAHRRLDGLGRPLGQVGCRHAADPPHPWL